MVDLFLHLVKIELVMTSLLRPLSFLQTIVHISISIETTNFKLGTDIQHYKVHLIIRVQVTLTDTEGHR